MNNNGASSAVKRWSKPRRTPRLEMSIPIRVFATDYRGRDFVEDSTTVTINFHGAKIQLERELVPEQEIRILSGRTGHEAIFRVVGRAGKSDGSNTYWGVESRKPGKNFWGIRFFEPSSDGPSSVQLMLRCPECHIRELVELDDSLLEQLKAKGGLSRLCSRCRETAVWTQVAYET